MDTFTCPGTNTTQWTTEGLVPAPTSTLEDDPYINHAALLQQTFLSEISQPSSSEQTYTRQDSQTENVYPYSRCTSWDFEQLDASWTWLQQDDEKVPTDTKRNRKERRQAQNRSAQRAYRQRKEQAIKDAERVIETLKTELAKEVKETRELRKILESFKHQLQQSKMFQGSVLGLMDPQGDSPQ